MKNATISFKTSKADAILIGKIVKRAMAFKVANYDGMTCNMDVTACHVNGNPLDLARLLIADDFNFMHDVMGIANHIDRNTGKLTDYFVPRMSAKELSGVAS